MAPSSAYTSRALLTILRNADVFAPEPLGRRDLLLGGGRVLQMAPALPALPAGVEFTELDLQGARLVPGFIDAHVHLTGGGGEAGPKTRVPPLPFSALSRAGVTTVVGLLGTDGTTRTMHDLVARTLALRDEGLTAYCWTGSYEVPPRTLTGSVRGDLCFVDPIIGVGELALSDHRSSQPTLDELLRVAADCHVGGMMSGKAGVLHLHLGDGARGLDLVRHALEASELPARVFHPTHVNRNRRLFAAALELPKRGTCIDVTAFPADDDGYSAAEAIERYYFAADLPRERLTCSSDGAGCLPVFDGEGRMVEMGIGQPAALNEALRELLARGISLSDALPPFTSNPARLLRLPAKGRIAEGCDADFVALDEQGRIGEVIAAGRLLVRSGAPCVLGTFERKS